MTPKKDFISDLYESEDLRLAEDLFPTAGSPSGQKFKGYHGEKGRFVAKSQQKMSGAQRPAVSSPGSARRGLPANQPGSAVGAGRLAGSQKQTQSSQSQSPEQGQASKSSDNPLKDFEHQAENGKDTKAGEASREASDLIDRYSKEKSMTAGKYRDLESTLSRAEKAYRDEHEIDKAEKISEVRKKVEEKAKAEEEFESASDEAFDSSSEKENMSDPEGHAVASEKHKKAAEMALRLGHTNLAHHHMAISDIHKNLSENPESLKSPEGKSTLEASNKAIEASSIANSSSNPADHVEASKAHLDAADKAKKSGHEKASKAHEFLAKNEEYKGKKKDSKTASTGEQPFGAPTEEHHQMGKDLSKALKASKVPGKVEGGPKVGPRAVSFDVRMKPGASSSKLTGSAETLARDLGLDPKSGSISIQQGKGGLMRVSVPLPENKVKPIHFNDVTKGLPKRDSEGSDTQLFQGINQDTGAPEFVDVTQDPHTLRTGQSGSGKTEAVLSTLSALMHSNSPSKVKFEVIDGKGTSFGDMKGSPYLLKGGKNSVIGPDDFDKAPKALQAIVDRMENRNKLLASGGHKDLAEYNKANPNRSMPRVFVVVDELSNLLTNLEGKDPAQKKSVMNSLKQIAQKARSSGIHLILSTQTPSKREIPDADLRNNLTNRVSGVMRDPGLSDEMFGQGGAETLGLRGDTLMKKGNSMLRVQAPWLGSKEEGNFKKYASGSHLGQ
jgi:hypothetical protein